LILKHFFLSVYKCTALWVQNTNFPTSNSDMFWSILCSRAGFFFFGLVFVFLGLRLGFDFGRGSRKEEFCGAYLLAGLLHELPRSAENFCKFYFIAFSQVESRVYVGASLFLSHTLYLFLFPLCVFWPFGLSK